jgi:hypothetical protein
MLLSLAVVASLAPQGPSTAPVVINEIAYDDQGTDALEFVELYNRTAAAVDLSGWRVQGEEGDAAGSPNLAFTFPAGTTINPGQYIVVGNTAVPNVNFTVATNFLENGTAEGLTLRDPADVVVDGIAYGFAVWTAPVPAWLEGSMWGRLLLNDGATFLGTRQSWSRWTDGYDSNNNGLDFLTMTWTPGASNSGGNVLAAPYVNSFDGAPGTNAGADFASSFVAPVIYDPSAITNATSSTISLPPSPQGGNVAVWNDPTGGGNSHTLRVQVGTQSLVECFVYVKGGTAALGGTEGEAWAIGIGTTDSYASPVDGSGTYYATASACTAAGNREPGATGLAWFAYNTTADTSLYLLDMNDGGPGFTVLAGPIVCTTGSNDGWQRLRLRVDGTSYVANFGGTFGANDGQSFSGTLATAVQGQAYLQYRECVLTNANLTPLVVDQLEIYGIVNASVTFAGAGSPTSVGVPTIGTNGSPNLGNLGFAIQAGSMIPGGVGAVLLTLGTLGSGLPVPGAPPTVQLYVSPFVANLVFSNGLGNASFALGLPAANALAGLPIAAQVADFDPTLAFPVPIGTSQGMQLVVGN